MTEISCSCDAHIVKLRTCEYDTHDGKKLERTECGAPAITKVWWPDCEGCMYLCKDHFKYILDRDKDVQFSVRLG